MKLPELKKKVWTLWTKLNSWKGELTSSPESFVAEMKGIGDRRYKQTWITALCRFEATMIHRNCLDAWTLIAYSFNYTPERWDYEFRHEILDEFLTYPDGLELIKVGLEQIFASSDFSPQEQQETTENGFFELVGERAEKFRRIGFAVGSARRVERISPSASAS
jgi:hypothetical protein